MSTDDAWNVQVSLKSRSGGLLNVRGDTVATVKEHLADLMDGDTLTQVLSGFAEQPVSYEQATSAARKAFPNSSFEETPNCPQCGGTTRDVRDSKKSAKGPDFICEDPNCTNDKGYRTGVWAKRGGRDS